ncbi:MAG: 2-C-methyl-D-erythritol 4-phosphate cytidylyltransferase [Lentisphaeria bacterium]
MQEEYFADTALIIAAGGSNRRFGPGRNKLLLSLKGMPVICHALRNFLPMLDPALALVLVPAGMHEVFKKALAEGGIPPEVRVETGGESRQESVMNGLRALPEKAEYVAVQDGARPFTSAEILKACLISARRRGSGIAAHKVTDTIKVANPDGQVTSTPDRNTLWASETPQVFKTSLIREAYEKVIRENRETTDDAQVLESTGHPVYLVPHQENNRKITFAHDLDNSADHGSR